MPNGEKTTVEQLQSEVSDLEKLLNELRTKTFSDAEREKKEKDAKSKAEKLQGQIDALSKQEGIDPRLAEEKEKAKVLLESYEKTLGLKSSIKEKPAEGSKTDKKESTDTIQTQVQPEGQNPDETTEEKGFWGKAGDWIGDQWSDVTSRDKRKEQPGQNALRFIGGLGIGLAGYGIYKGAKKLWNRAFGKKKKDKESEGKSSSESSSKKGNSSEEKSFWDGTVGKTIKTVGSVLAVGTGVYYVTHGLYTKNRGLNDLWDWERGKKLDFDTAMDYCKGAIANQNNKECMSYGMNLKYHEDTGEIEAYGERIKIDKFNRKIEGLNIDFKNYEHMINTVIVTAYLKKNYSGKCKTNDPFKLNGSRQGDIDVNTGNGKEEAIDGTGSGGRITGIGTAAVASIITAIRSKNLKLGASVLTAGGALGFVGGYLYDTDNIMHNHMPELDNENGKQTLAAYLNNMNCRQARNQTEDDITESPIKTEIVECMENIQNTNKELTERGGYRKLDAIQDPNNEKRYTIKAYGRDFLSEVTGEEGNRKIRILGITGGNPEIKTDMEKSGIGNLELPLKEGCYMSCFLGFLLENKDIIHKGVKYPRFEYTSRGLGVKKGIYFNDANVISFDYDTRILTKDKFKERMPTLFKDENRKKLLEFLNDGIMDKETNASIRKKID